MFVEHGSPSSLDSPAAQHATPPSANESPASYKPIIWAIGGGKGGVGKSVIATNLSVQLANSGKRVVLIDADLGGANLDTLLGCDRPEYSLGDFFSKRISKLEDAAQQTRVPGLSLIAGDADSLGAANPQHAQKLKLIRHFRNLPADYVILDLGAGSTFNTLDLYLSADLGIVVTTPEPTSVQNCFTFLKAVTLREIERRTGTKQRDLIRGSLHSVIQSLDPSQRSAIAHETNLVVNRASTGEARKILDMLSGLVRRFLHGSVQLAGAVRQDQAVVNSVKSMRPVLVSAPHSESSDDIRSLMSQLTNRDDDGDDGFRMGMNEEYVFEGTKLHIQTEDLGGSVAAIRTQIFFHDGRVAYSRRTAYADTFFQKLKVKKDERARAHHHAIKRGLKRGRIKLTGLPT